MAQERNVFLVQKHKFFIKGITLLQKMVKN